MLFHCFAKFGVHDVSGDNSVGCHGNDVAGVVVDEDENVGVAAG